MTNPVPADFPAPAPRGAVPGAQPKVLAQVDGEQFVATDGPEQLRARFEVCEDLARQVAGYAGRKATACPELPEVELVAKVMVAVRQKAFGWGLSPAEAEWVLKRFQELRSKAQPGKDSVNNRGA